MPRYTVPLNEALQALRNEAARGPEKTASVEPSNAEQTLAGLLRKTAHVLRETGEQDVTYSDLYRVKEAFCARR